MRKQICCETPTRIIRIGWVSFQPDGSISFGLNDKTYISPKFKTQTMIWNAYNRIKMNYVVETDPSALEPVRNPHFTYHPTLVFQLKGEDAGADILFRGIADVGIILQQQGEMPWISAISGTLIQLATGGRRADDIAVEELSIKAPHEKISVRMDMDFVRSQPRATVRLSGAGPHWFITWREVCLRLRISLARSSHHR